MEALANISEISDDHNTIVVNSIESATSSITWAATLKEDVAKYIASSNEDEDNDDNDASSASIAKSSILIVLGIMLWQKL